MQREYHEQVVVAQWLRMRRGLLWTATAAGGPRHIVAARHQKAAGLIPGCPDLLIFTPPKHVPDWYEGECNGVAIELKSTAKTARVSPAQQWWLSELRKCAWLATVARGADEAIRLLTSCGY